MMRLLVSVRTIGEALQAAAAGAQLIDLKEPREGALGALPFAEIHRIVAVMRNAFPRVPVSATTGDFDAAQAVDVLDAAERVGACGVDYVKVGVSANHSAPSLLARLARFQLPIVPVMLCDEGLDADTVRAACNGPFPALMCDTRDKRNGSLFECASTHTLAAMLETARTNGKLAGLAGALRLRHVAQLVALAPDFAGFRGAVCRGERTDELDPAKVRELASALHDARASASTDRGGALLSRQ